MINKKIMQFITSILFVTFSGASINAVIWESVGILISFNRGHQHVWEGPTPDMFRYLKLLLFAIFAIPAFFKVRNVEVVYRRFRWIFAAAWGSWILIVLALGTLTGGDPGSLAFARLIPDPAKMGMMAGVMTVLLFFRTHRKKLKPEIRD